MFLPRNCLPAHSRHPTLALLVVALLAFLGCPHVTHAQDQESVAMNRLLHPDQTLKFNDSDHGFDAKAAAGSKQATVRPFLFNRPASTKVGDGVFRTRNFSGTDAGYHTVDFTTKAATAAGRDAYSQTGRTYAVRAVAVHEDRAAGKTMDTRTYVSSGKPFLVRGKRQDTIDELRAEKQMSIDEVRELLNKNR